MHEMFLVTVDDNTDGQSYRAQIFLQNENFMF